ncbi:MAG TPA: 4-hydroxy-3-methylbut-2-enyl diphosphate reductase [Thermoleophilia bacterium]|nr:4-hydroxy-3-methylbut-2-enyl diphosphate reductase [Thermoleophilia bacterium]
MSPFRVTVASSAGFCWGVERALRKARDAVETAKGPIETLGPLIHNPGVIADLASQGIGLVDDVDTKTEGTVIIRSHGVPRGVMESLAAGDVAVVDATCSFVKSAQTRAARLHDEGYRVIILGEPDHPEVLGIRSYAGPDAVVVEGPEDLPDDLDGRRVGVVVQTTQSQARLAAITAALVTRVRELRVCNTICSATERRQEAAVAMAADADVVVVVGGRTSGNTKRLVELCAQVQPHTHHIERAEEIDPAWLDGAAVVGVTAGASTPATQIESVVERLRELGS